MALSYLGANSIIEITDETEEAKLCLRNYDNTRDAVLEDVNWTFATRRIILGTPCTESPIFGYGNKFLVPAEVLRIISVNDNQYEWVLEEGFILSDSGMLEVIAVVKVENPHAFPPSFVTAFASRLAAEIALPITNSPTQMNKMIEMYQAKKLWARANDGRQGLNKVKRLTHGFRR